MSNIKSDFELDMKVVIIHWLMWWGKTMASTLISSNDFSYTFQKNNKYYKKYRIYSNFDIFYKQKKIVKNIKYFNDLKKIRFSKYPGVIIIDEMANNANSKDSRSINNRLISSLTFIARKINCSLIFISQRFMSIPVDQREVASLIIKVKKIKSKNHPKFIIDSEKRLSQNKKILLWRWSRDMISHLKYLNINYNQLDTSQLT